MSATIVGSALVTIVEARIATNRPRYSPDSARRICPWVIGPARPCSPAPSTPARVVVDIRPPKKSPEATILKLVAFSNQFQRRRQGGTRYETRGKSRGHEGLRTCQR